VSGADGEYPNSSLRERGFCSGRSVASVSGFPYSPGLIRSLVDPSGGGTGMGTFGKDMGYKGVTGKHRYSGLYDGRMGMLTGTT